VSPAPRNRSLLVGLTVAGLVVAGSVAAGCTKSGTAVTTPFDTTPPVLQHGPTYEVKAATVGGLGTVLADGQGITVYMFASDHQGSPSRCYGICAIQWPAVTLPSGVAAPVAGPGIRAGLLSTAPRTDGTTQITYNGWPLYRWPPDRSPGQATGQALTNAGGLWFVVDPAGNPVRTPLSA
jgi:predicted lipoprotein with Yx(FWY)xxD motif